MKSPLSNRRRPSRWWVPAVAAVLVGPGCYPFEVEDVAQLDAVATLRDPQASFSTIGTYVVPDSVVQINEDEDGSVPLSHDFDDLILSTVRSHLDAVGYIEEPDPANNAPDVAVIVYATGTEDTNVYVSYPWYDYWGWYPYWPCCGPGWGVGYPPTISVVTYETGTLFIEMLDLRTPNDAEQEVSTIWIAALRGLLGTSSSSTQARITTAIDRAFDQSTYLGR